MAEQPRSEAVSWIGLVCNKCNTSAYKLSQGASHFFFFPLPPSGLESARGGQVVDTLYALMSGIPVVCWGEQCPRY